MPQVLRMPVGGRAVVPMVDPKHGNIGTFPDHQMEQSSFVGTKIGGNYRPGAAPAQRPAHDLLRGQAMELGVQDLKFGGRRDRQ